MGAEKIGGTILNVLEDLGLRDAKKCAIIISRWDKIAGEGLKNLVNPERYRHGILHISVMNHSWAQELQMLKPQFLKKINAEIGKDVVKDIRFQVQGKSR